jgi:predicted dehydrogenase
MNEPNSITRRQFLDSSGRTAALLAASTSLAPGILSAKSSNETIGVGCIGLGTRGGDLIKGVTPVEGVKVVAVCDVYKPHLQKGIDRSNNPDVKAYVDYRELLADRNVDAVVIGTPDHWHKQITLDAAKAGKDIYCEKGWGLSVPDVKEMRDTVKAKQVVFQLGHQARQETCALQAKQLLAEGILGPVTLVRTGRFMNSDPQHMMWRWYGYYSQWQKPADPQQVRRDLNWELWLGSAPKRDYDPGRFWQWRCYWDYGTGIAGDLLSHEIDFVQYLLGHGIPDTCMTTGMIAYCNDGREVPDTWNSVFEWQKHNRTASFQASFNASAFQPVEVCGKEGILRFNGIAHDVSDFEIVVDGFNRRKDSCPTAYQKGKTERQPNHMQDFFNCVRSRKKTKCNEDEGYIETVTYLMAVKSLREKRQVRWDAQKQEIV